MTAPERARPPRERILRAAARLFSRSGVQAVGVDAVVAEAGVAKASLYKHFPTKADLVAAVLDSGDPRAIERYRGMLDSAGTDPRERVLALFDGLDALVSGPGFRGCAYVNAGLALADLDHPAHAVVRRHKGSLRDLLLAEATTAGVADPAAVADGLLLLVDGVLATGALRPETRPARSARTLAALLLDAGGRPGGAGTAAGG